MLALGSGPIVTIILVGVLLFALIIFFKTIRVVPQKMAYIIERLGKYSTTLEAGFHILVPFIDRVAYKHTLKEQALDVPPWRLTASCICRLLTLRGRLTE
jgi:regulator of protease activity HflC (stomatin/prohibitin superfamily)